MRTTVNIDDELLARAHAATHVTAMAELIREALKALVERESARQLAKLGGVKPGFGRFPTAVSPMILIDTSVWVEHLERRLSSLAPVMLLRDAVCPHSGFLEPWHSLYGAPRGLQSW